MHARPMRLLVLGGTRFVGRAVIAEAIKRGWNVTALHRGVTGGMPPDVTVLYADRADNAVLASSLGTGTWDIVVDPWSGAPRVATAAAELLAERADQYCYISSGSVYVWGTHVNETSPVVEGSAAGQTGDYPALKRGAELGVLTSFPNALLARPGLDVEHVDADVVSSEYSLGVRPAS